jgi:NosR/NirI family transcriptional regulator, nitrous oxide reductase regulator
MTRHSHPESLSRPSPLPKAGFSYWWTLVWLTLACFSLPVTGWSEQRFPPPDFAETGHKLPTTAMPFGRGIALEYLDLVVLAISLGVATWLVHRQRSRKGLIALSVFSLLYFGFWRRGCVCAIGSPQNVALSLFGTGYAVPLVVVGFFTLPLLFALFAGRSFCAGVCPHGALQDLVLLKPIKVPAWLEHSLGILPYVYLGAGILFAATGCAFIFCQYDPFVPVFRMNGRTLMVLSGVALLLLGTVVGRPYCRFLCPYGALLNMAATLSKLRVRVTPNICTQCRLCEASCPFGAMREPEAGKARPETRGTDRRRLMLFLLLLPVLMGVGAWVGSRCGVPAARLHPTVSLAQLLVREDGNPPKTGTLTPDERALERARENPRETLETAAAITRKVVIGATLLGAWIGLVIGAKLISLSVRRTRSDYEPDRGTCFACARCFEYCPNELVRRGFIPGSPTPIAPVQPKPVPATVLNKTS